MRPRTATPHPLRTGLAALGAAALFGAGSLAFAPTASAATPDTTLKVEMTGIGVDTLNPFLSYFAGSLSIFGSIYPTLDQLSPTGQAEPYLADSWTTSADKLTWTFKIHQGLKWSDGQPITAADVAWTFNLIMSNTTAATANGSLVGNFKSVTAPNASTLVITTKTPQANMLAVSIPVNGIPIVPEHIWQSHVAGLATYRNNTFPIVGYGPWTMTAYQTDQYAKFDANPSFVLGAPKFNHMIMQSFKTTDAAVAALRSGQLDYVGGVDATQYKALKGQPNIGAYQEVGNLWNAVEINAGAKSRSGKPLGNGNPALADPAVRTAIATAIDKSALVDKVEDGLAEPGVGYLPPSLPQFAWTPSTQQQLSFDLAKANQILDKAGYTKGADGIRVDPKTKQPLDLRLGIHSDTASDTEISTYIAGWLQEIGIDVTIDSMSSTKLNDDLSLGNWDMLMDSWSSGPDPTYLLGIQTCGSLPLDNGTGGNTDSFYCNPAYDSLFNAQQGEFDTAQRAATLGQMQSILYQANSDIILYYPDTLDLVRTDKVSGLEVGAPGSDGAYPAQVSFNQYLNAAPVVAAKGGGGSSSGLVIGGVVLVLVVLAGGSIAVKRRRTADERE